MGSKSGQTMEERISAMLDAALKRRGIDDADAYLKSRGEDAKLSQSPRERSAGGSVHIAMGRKVDRESINKRIKKRGI